MQTGVKSFDHVAITVEDMERSVAFYSELLGFTILGQLMLNDNTFKIVYLRSGGASIELFAFKEKGKAVRVGAPDTDLGFKHVALRTDDVDGVTRRLKENGVTYTTEPTDATGDVRLAFFRDPDGNLLELVSDTPNLKPYSAAWE